MLGHFNPGNRLKILFCQHLWIVNVEDDILSETQGIKSKTPKEIRSGVFLTKGRIKKSSVAFLIKRNEMVQSYPLFIILNAVYISYILYIKM